MHRAKPLPLLAALLGVLLVALAVVYAVRSAASLPAFLPGHVAAGDPEHAHHHLKHAIAALAVGCVLLAYAWLNTGGEAGAVVTRGAR